MCGTLLFEEPEAFLHPSQQLQMSDDLRKLAQKDGQQVLITSHSSHFVSNSMNKINEIIKLNKNNCKSDIYQLTENKIKELFEESKDLADFLKELKRKKPNLTSNIDKLLNKDTEKYKKMEDSFRYQLYLNADRASLFFVDHVIIVEGVTEKALLNYLFNNEWKDLKNNNIYVLDTFGKYQMHKFIKLLTLFGIKHSIIVDRDKNNSVEFELNEFIKSKKNEFTLGDVIEIPDDIESFLGIEIKGEQDKRKKDLKVLCKIENKTVDIQKIDKLKELIIPAIPSKSTKRLIPEQPLEIYEEIDNEEKKDQEEIQIFEKAGKRALDAQSAQLTLIREDRIIEE